jgi:hypothetical protein
MRRPSLASLLNAFPLMVLEATLKDIAAKRSWMINKQHLAQLIELGLVEMREDVPHLTIAGQNATWKA